MIKKPDYNTDDAYKIIIAGSRSFMGPENYKLLKKKMDKMVKGIKGKIVILSGVSKGADAFGEKWAFENGYTVMRFHPDWKRCKGGKYDKTAGMKRNVEMAKQADACVVFWDGVSPGTKGMIEIAKKHKLQLRVVRFEAEE